VFRWAKRTRTEKHEAQCMGLSYDWVLGFKFQHMGSTYVKGSGTARGRANRSKFYQSSLGCNSQLRSLVLVLSRKNQSRYSSSSSPPLHGLGPSACTVAHLFLGLPQSRGPVGLYLFAFTGRHSSDILFRCWHHLTLLYFILSFIVNILTSCRMSSFFIISILEQPLTLLRNSISED
jgi:hypothetical protein